MKEFLFCLGFCLSTIYQSSAQGYILLPMDDNQSNHMKAYGITYQVLAAKQEAYLPAGAS